MTDPFAKAVKVAIETCKELANSDPHHGRPVLVSDMRGPVSWPLLPITPDMPVVNLIVQSDGVWMVTARRRDAYVLTEPRFFRYQMINRVPCMSGFSLGEWREEVGCALTAALANLPAAGSARTSP